MGTRLALLLPGKFTLKNSYFPGGTLPRKTMVVFLFCLAVGVAIYLVSWKVVGFFHRQSELGIILSLKIFQMSWMILFAMVLFSCMVTAVSTVFLSQDNEIVWAAPVQPHEIFCMRYVSTSLIAGWMMVVFAFPIFAAYGRVFSAGWLYWPLLASALVATVATATALGMLAIIILVNLFPARRTKDIVLYLSICFGILLYLLFRLLRPEELVDPDKYAHFIDYLSSLSAPAGPFVPASWASNLLSTYLLDRRLDWLLFGLLLLTPPVLFFCGEIAMDRLFFKGYTKSQESFGGHRQFKGLSSPPAPSWIWIFRKELRTFLRDSAEWSQLFMIAALVVVYLYNFKVLPLERSYMTQEYLVNLISFLNVGLTGFVIASLAARFVFPAIGSEGPAFFLIQSAPVSLRRFLFYKYLFYVVPFTALSTALIIISNHLLKVSGPMWAFSLIASLIITATVVAVALGFGARYADFKAENRASALGGMGAILFLLTAASYELVIIFSGAYPVYKAVRLGLRGMPLAARDMALLIAWLLVAMGMSIFVALFFLKKGIKSLDYPNQ